MARKRKQLLRSMTLSAALRNLVEVIAGSVVDKLRREIPAREQLRRIEQQLARISRRVVSVRGKTGARRVGRPRSNRRCKLRGCELPHVAHGLCSKHYQAWRRKRLHASG